MPTRLLAYSDLPSEVVEFLGDADAVKVVDGIMDAQGIPKERAAEFSGLVEGVILGQINIRSLPDMIAVYGISDDKAQAAAIELVGKRILPVAEAVGLDVAGALKAWGADAGQFKNVKRVEVKEAKDDKEGKENGGENLVHKALTGKGAVFSDPVLQHRLELIVASYKSGVRTADQAVAVMARSIKTGGLEMGEQVARDVLALVGVAEVPVIASAAKQSPEIASVVSLPRNDSGVKGSDDFSTEDEVEVKQIAKSKKAAMAQPVLITDTKAAAEKIIVETKLVFPTGELKTRFEHIIDARLRDVRDGFETQQKLEAPVEQGGVGLSGVQLANVMERVEKMDEMHHRALAMQLGEKKVAAMAAKASRAATQAAVQKQEEQVMAKRYAEITGVAPKETVAPPTERTTAAMPAHEEVQRREQMIDTAKVKAAIEAAKPSKPSVTPVMSEPTIPTTAAGRPKVEDVRFERKLVGPIEELKLLTLADFRRLSKDPKQAVLKIRDKVDLVKQEGYDRLIAAVKAWRASPLFQLYVALSREAVQVGKSPTEILALKRAAGEEVPTDEELRAIVKLNGSLRF
jgi:hypothetical protein